MSQSRTFRWIHRKTTARSRRSDWQRRATRRLSTESLEQRLLLTTITAVQPPANSHDAAASTDIAATFDQDVVAATATPQNFVVHGSASQGQLTGVATAVAATGPVITHTPTNTFAAGELVQVTATSGISTTGGAAVSRVWQFRTASSGSGQFVDAGTLFETSSAEQITLGDIDGDGDLDAALGGSELWTNDGTGVFTNSGQNLGADLGEPGSQLADIDGDGDLDLVAGSRVALNDGSGGFTNTGQDLGGGAATTGDLDGDGDLDFMTGVAYAPNRVAFNNGSGQFTDSGQSLGNASTDGISFGDFDDDGDLDAFERISGTPNRIWLNDGSGVFTDSGQAIGTFRATKDADLGDVDGDGDLDIVVGNSYTGMAHLYLNDGGLFTESPQPLANANSPFIYGVNLVDVDGDGDLDFMSSDRLTANQIWLNDGSGAFTDTGQRLIYMGKGQVWGTTVGDVDGDGDVDLLEVNRTSPGGGRLWLNQNLTPNVSLSVDSPTINEAAGTAAITATLSAVHTDPVTIDLGISGSATATDDYTVSGTQIVIPIGATTGSVTVTAEQDAVDEPDETVIVEITGVTNGQELGTQQVTTTILDDDEAVVVPDVTLSVDNANIPEEAGLATFTATLSTVTTVPVTIDLEISGTADASDFTASGTQIVVAPGATTGSITVTAVQDEVDESDETVIVDIANVTGGNESGTQQQTTTITDDDEAPTPDVTLSVDNANIAEAGGVATFTVTLSEVTTVSVTVDLEITGTAAASDYNASGTQIVVAPGATTGSVTVTAVDDLEDESDETVIVDISAVTGGNETGEQQQTATIADDDDPPKLTVTTLTATESGFVAEFATDLNTSLLNLYDTQSGGLGPADVVLQGASVGPVGGSLVVDPALRKVTFLKSGDPLSPDTYTVTLRSAADGFVDAGGQLLDGNDDGTEGDDYNSTFEVAEAAAGAVTIGIPDIVRGPGQDVNLPADETNGIPVTMSGGANIRAVDMRVAYDPELLTISGASVGPDAPAGASVIANTTTPGLAILVFFSTNPLPDGGGTFINLEASVPATDPSGIYGTQQVLDVHGVIVSDGNDNESPAVVDDAFQLASFFADVSGNGRINAADASGVARIAALIDGGFAGSPNADPSVVGDISGNGRLNAADASLLAQFAALIDVPQIPPIPAGVVITGSAAADSEPDLLGVAILPSRLDDYSSSLRAADSSDRSEGPTELVALPYPAVDRAMAELEDSRLEGDELELTPLLKGAVDQLLSAELLIE